MNLKIVNEIADEIVNGIVRHPRGMEIMLDYIAGINLKSNEEIEKWYDKMKAKGEEIKMADEKIIKCGFCERKLKNNFCRKCHMYTFASLNNYNQH